MEPSSSSSIIIGQKQRNNPMLRFIRLVPSYIDETIIPDYIIGTSCAIFLSTAYHVKYPAHAERRIREIGKNFKLRVLLVHVNDEDHVKALRELNKLCFVNDFTLILAWSYEECARYLESLKTFENKSTGAIQEKVETEFLPKLTKTLTTVRSINKTDVVTLLNNFGNFGNICTANEDDLVSCPGIGDKKVKRLYQALHEPFLKKAKSSSFDSSSSYKPLQGSKVNDIS